MKILKSYLTFLVTIIILSLFQISAYSQSIESSSISPLLEQLITSNQSSFNVSGENINEVKVDKKFNYSDEAFKEIQKFFLSEILKENDLEIEYSNRANNKLSLIGYDFFKNMFNTTTKDQSPRSGAIQDLYLVGIGDEITVQLRGGKTNRITSKVLNNGTLLFSFSDPLLVAGLTFGEVKKEIKKIVKAAFVETDAYISLGELKQISVTVSGEVNIPGQHQVSSLVSVLDLLLLSGGINKKGSLRNIEVYTNGKKYNFDLYNIIFGIEPFKTSSINFTDGSIIVVPPIGRTVGIIGDVNNPGIYEIKDNKLLIKDIFELSGISEHANEYFLKRISKKLKDNLKLDVNSQTNLNNKDLIFVIPKKISSGGLINLYGAVKNPFSYPFQKYQTLSSILPSSNYLNSDAYKFSFILKTENENTLRQEYKTINFWNVFKNKRDLTLKPNDELLVLKTSDLDFILSRNVLNALDPKYKFQSFNCNAIKKLNEYVKALSLNGESPFLSVRNSLKNMFTNINDKNFTNNSYDLLSNDCPDIYLKHPDLLKYVIQSLIFIKGDISNPGVYIFDKNDKSVSIKDLVLYAGYKEGKIIVSPDKKNINIISQNIQITGAVRFPQKLNIKDGTMLSEIFPDASFTLTDTYPLLALIKRRESKTGSLNFVTFNPEETYSGSNDITLRNGDIIQFFSQEEIFKIMTLNEQSLQENKTNLNDETENQPSLKTSEKIVQTYDSDNITNPKEEEADFSSKILNLAQNLNKNNIKDISSLSSINELISSIQSSNSESENLPVNDNSENNEVEKKIEDDIETDNSINTEVMAKENHLIESIIKSKMVNLSGSVVSRGFYPIGGKAKISSIISIAGGFSNDADTNRIEIQRLNSSELINGKIFAEPGDQIFVHSNNILKNNIKILGSIEDERQMGFFPGFLLSNVINNPNDLKPNTYLYFATIYRKGAKNNYGKFYAFSPDKILQKKQDIILEKGDEITLYSNEDIQLVVKNVVKSNKNLSPSNKINYKIENNNAGSLSELIRKFTVEVKGAVEKPGLLPLGSEYSLKEIIDIAGGFTEEAKIRDVGLLIPTKNDQGSIVFIQNRVDVLTQKNIIVNPGSVVRVSKISTDIKLGQIEITGAVNQPGIYQIRNNENIFSILKRTGGLKANAFIEGLVFSRIEEQEREKKSLERLKSELEKSLALSLGTLGSKSDISSLAGMQEILSAASNAKPIGRIVGDFTSIDLLKNTSVKSGDKLFIPSKPTSITIVGETLTPGSILWDQSKSIDDYFESVAGFTELADKKRIFLIEPNGKSKRVSGLWNANYSIRPGSTIVVPRRIVLASNLEKVSAVTSIIYQLTLSLAGIESVLNR